MPVAFLQLYVSANALVMLALALMLGVRALSARLARPISYRHLLHFGYVLVVSVVLGSWLAASSTQGDFLPKTTQVWSAPSMNAAVTPQAGARSTTVSVGPTESGIPLDWLTRSLVAVCLGGLLVALGRVLAGVRATRRIIRGAQLIKRSGALRVLSTDEAEIPFSFWLPGRCYIVVPSSLVVRPNELRVALRHEAQHHRHGDSRLLYAIELLKGAFLLNPAMHVLCRQLRELQEFACDESLADRRNLTARAYCDCLLWVAQSARRPTQVGSCLQMTDGNGAGTLLRRIEAVLSKPKEYLRRSAVFAMNAVAVLTLVATGIVLPGTVKDRRVTIAQANEMAAVAQAGSAFPIVVDEQVVAELNRLLGTPDGRTFVSESLRRMRAYETLISGRLAHFGLPPELLAVPIVESGYRNLRQGTNPAHGAGVWMFIKPTARSFGLTVEAAQDDRLDVALETDAALRMLSRLHAEFDDWGLALLAYNGGRELVKRGIRETGSRDAYQLVRKGYENDSGYVPRTMAAVIVLRNADAL